MMTEEAAAYLQTAYPKAVIDKAEQWGQKSLVVDKESLIPVLTFLRDDPKAGFKVLIDLTGIDYLQPRKHTKVIYHLHQPKTFARLRVIAVAGRSEKLPSATTLWAGADWYERELFDLFGINFEGHPDMKRILMPDDWTGHPLRRDYALTEEPVEFKHGVNPKVPSQIIPYVQFNQR